MSELLEQDLDCPVGPSPNPMVWIYGAAGGGLSCRACGALEWHRGQASCRERPTWTRHSPAFSACGKYRPAVLGRKVK